ncbi:hypothetical protein EW146_g7179 [Bondarzewia mesenterica]|uniref:Retrotransposon Copia-like N-terminal domain-containing protein n=1 Tax=Bondarzewia mesenterica TaxID=1095465 RepID=A0A4V3XEC9_9AGAM|nr:hypothetical protein EW146_g7179 [Bondarzewia mesenterica]
MGPASEPSSSNRTTMPGTRGSERDRSEGPRFAPQISERAQRALDDTLGVNTFPGSDSPPNSLDSSGLHSSKLTRAYTQLPPLSAVITRGAGIFDVPLPPDPLFATHHSNLSCPLTPEEEQRLTMNLMSVASKFDASSITQLAGITNYSDWARVCESALKSTGLARYVRGSSIKPDDTESKDYYLWCAWDEQTAELILRTVTKDVYDQIKQDVPYSTSHQLWDGMRKLFVNSGILSQVNYLRRALRHIFPPDEPYRPTIRAI